MWFLKVLRRSSYHLVFWRRLEVFVFLRGWVFGSFNLNFSKITIYRKLIIKIQAQLWTLIFWTSNFSHALGSLIHPTLIRLSGTFWILLVSGVEGDDFSDLKNLPSLLYPPTIFICFSSRTTISVPTPDFVSIFCWFCLNFIYR